MALKVENVTVPSWDGGRDGGKVFKITEMPAAQAEKWALRALLILESSGERVPADVKGLGMVGVAILGLNIWLRGNIKVELLEPLMDEMFTCIRIVRDPRHPDVATDLVSDNDIEDVKTRLWLRSEVLRVHTDFSPADALSKLLSQIRAPADETSPST